jgi:beta-glucosidase/6-phospho-beta-glucosidase/beta-galactosidase
MSQMRIGPEPENFWWAGGVENTFVPQVRPGHRSLDEFELMEHYQNWKTDLSVVSQLGIRAIRWGAPWYKLEPERGVFDWSWTDSVIPYIVEELGLTLVADLMHYGCPFWLEREFMNKDYPSAVARYEAAFTARYKDLVRYYTPLNEPVVNALMCGKRGLWPPYLRGDGGYVRIMVQLAQGIAESSRAIRGENPNAKLVFVEATGLSRAAHADLEPLAMEDQHRAYICYDLLTGRVTRDHPLYTWLLRNGAAPAALERLARHPVKMDVLGMNFYPQWSVKQLYINRNGKLASRVSEGGESFSSLIEDYYRRYQVPIMITETSAFGPDEIRSAWLKTSIAAIRRLRERGVPVYGYTWFPLHTMIDWRYRFGVEPLQQYKIELGMFTLNGKDGQRWRPTPLVDQFRSYAMDPENSVGNMLQPIEEAHESPHGQPT